MQIFFRYKMGILYEIKKKFVKNFDYNYNFNNDKISMAN